MPIVTAVIGAGIAAAGTIGASALSAGGAQDQGALALQQQQNLLNAANKIPNINWEVGVEPMESRSIEFGLSNAPVINEFNMGQLQGMLDKVMPGWKDMFGQANVNAAALLRGAIPTDVSQMVQRNAAQTALTGGFAGTAATGALTARDLGLTSLQLQQTGLSEFEQLLQTTRNYLMPQPIDPLSLLPLNTLVSASEFQKQGELSNALAKYTATANAFNVGYQGQQQAKSAETSAITGGIGGVTGILSKLISSGALNNIFSGGSGRTATNNSALGSVATGLSQSDFNSVIGGGFTSGGLDLEDMAALVGAGGMSPSSVVGASL